MESTNQYDSMRSFPGQSISSHVKRRTRDSIPTYKVLMIGNVDVGKTCLLMRLCEDRFPREKKEYTLGMLKMPSVLFKVQWAVLVVQFFKNITQNFYWLLYMLT